MTAIHYTFTTIAACIAACLVLFFGLALLLLSFSPYLQGALLAFFVREWITVFLMGWTLIGLGVLLVGSLLNTLRKPLYFIRSGAHAIAVDEKVVNTFLQGYWQERFPSAATSSYAAFIDQVLHITVTLPATEKKRQRPLLADIEKELRRRLRVEIGYTQPFQLLASFRN